MDVDSLREHFPDADGETLEMALGLLRGFDALVLVRCQGVDMLMPRGHSLWRGLQFWGMLTGRLVVDFSKFCLAGNCKQCSLTIRRQGQEPQVALACRAEPEAGMEILKLAEGFRLKR